MKTIIIFLLLLLCIKVIKGQQCNSYALHWDQNQSKEYLVSIDPSSGIITEIDSISGVAWISSGFSTFDSKNGRYLFRGGDSNGNWYLYSIDVNTGNIISNPPLNVSDGNICELQIDQSNGNLYALHWDQNQLKEYLVSIDPSTGNITEIDSISGVAWITSGFSAFDSKNGRYIFRGGDSNGNWYLYSIDVNTGNIISNPPLNVSGGNICELQIDQSTGNLYALHWDQTQSKEYLVSIDPSTGNITEIDSIPGVSWITSEFSTFDSKNGRYIFRGGDSNGNWYLYSIDVNTGNIISNPPLNVSDGNIAALHLPFLPIEYITVSSSSICANDSSLLSLPLGYNSYLWNTGETSNAIYISDSLFYSATLAKDFGCQTTSNEVSINVFNCTAFIDSITYNVDTCLFDSSAVAFAYVDNITILNDSVYLIWNFINLNGDTIQLNAVYYIHQVGIYSVSIDINCNGSKNQLNYYDIIQIKSLSISNDKATNIGIEVYPNPIKNKFTIEVFNSKAKIKKMKIEVINVNGQILKTFTISDLKTTVDISELSSGVYSLRLFIGNGVLTKSIIKQ